MSNIFSKSELNGTAADDRVFWMGMRQVALNVVDIIERRLEFDDSKRTAYLRKANSRNVTPATVDAS